ncbi:nitroreductase family protein [Pseudoalteromonas fenneropenaei]|uniref:Nitroreductase family protein n=1 Tax=Pseudoalteromonas fenneropenaei TaxID=1737459 RepID=A0ABV7CKC8_9GAMM
MFHFKKLIIRSIDLFRDAIKPLFAKYSFLSRLYYLLFDQSFAFEQQAILKGQVQYKRQSGVQQYSSSLLRRNIHRLEKGLIMRPRKPIFALDYITETIEIYKLVKTRAEFDLEELKWAESVLTEYFSIVDRHPKVDFLREQFESLCISIDSSFKPYPSTERYKHTVKYDEFLALAKARRSVRWFDPESVDLILVKKAIEIGLQAPSACNRQSYEFMLIDDAETLTKVVQLPGGTSGFADNIPLLIAVIGDLSCYPMARDRHLIYIDSSLASMQFMLALETLGLSSCAINWPELKKLDKRVNKLLALPQYKRVVMFIAVGHAMADGEIPYSQKKSVELVIETGVDKN